MFNVDFGLLLPVALIAISLGCVFYFVTRFFVVASATKQIKTEEWRDPPPLIYRVFQPFLRIFAPDLKGFLTEKTLQSAQTKLNSAGLSYAILPEELILLPYACMALGCIISATLFSVNGAMSLSVKAFVIGIIPISFVYPGIWIKDKIAARKSRVEKDFPFLLDFLVLSMRAGLTYSMALAQSVQNMPEGPIKEEFSKVLREIRAGKIRRAALLDLATRMNIPSVSNFVGAINQVEETGGELVDVLNIQAEQRRMERFSRAEVLANQAPVKMLIPMVLLLFPIIFMMIAFILIVHLNDSGILPHTLSHLLVK